MEVYKIINIAGLIISMFGTFLMFYYSPKVESRFFLYRDQEYAAMHKKDNRKNKLIRFGMFLLFVGFLFQLGSMLFQKI